MIATISLLHSYYFINNFIYMFYHLYFGTFLSRITRKITVNGGDVVGVAVNNRNTIL